MPLNAFAVQSVESLFPNKSYLQIDLSSVISNYKILQQKVMPSECAVVIKANAYGLGQGPIAKSLWEAGARSFFVATLEEGIALRSIIKTGSIFLLNGMMKGMESALTKFSLIPVLASEDMMKQWFGHSQKIIQQLPCAIQFDTGLHRLGMPLREVLSVFQDKNMMESFNIVHIMSHLSSAENQKNSYNEDQRVSFLNLREFFPNISGSLVNSGGIFLGNSYYFDMTRPGISLYGIGVPMNERKYFRHSITLKSPILQVFSLKKGDKVGYEGTYSMPEDGRIAIAGIGYADGYPHSLSNKGYGLIDGFKAPVAGRVSMDLLTLDVTHVPESFVYPGQFVTLVGEDLRVESVAKLAGMIPHEFLTGFGNRLERVYV